MHTFKMGNHRIHHNGDYGGDVILVEVAEGAEGGEHSISEMKVPARLLYSFTAAMIQDTKVEILESSSDEQLLGLPSGIFEKK